MLDQYPLIHYAEWDTLIILDALRFDYFKRYNSIRGKLRKVRSPAAHTYEWLKRTFPDFYDWTYFSAHPYINHLSRRQTWNANRHFKRIVNIWLEGWDDLLGTVPPDAVGECVKNTPYEKAIVHYIQPHGPWIGKTKWVNPWTLWQHEKHGVMADFIATKVKPDPRFFRRCYRDNLKLVLKSVEKYLPYFKGKVVITSDHGEMLGEKGLYLHKVNYPKWTDEILRNVPWLEVKG